MKASRNVNLGKRKTTVGRTHGVSRQPPLPPNRPQIGSSSSASGIPVIFRDNLQAQRYELFQGSIVYVCGRNIKWTHQ